MICPSCHCEAHQGQCDWCGCSYQPLPAVVRPQQSPGPQRAAGVPDSPAARAPYGPRLIGEVLPAALERIRRKGGR